MPVEAPALIARTKIVAYLPRPVSPLVAKTSGDPQNYGDPRWLQFLEKMGLAD
jgi:hypothetical protein